MFRRIPAFLAAPLLAGCVADSGSSYRPSSSYQSSAASSGPRLNSMQRDALADGCRLRYNAVQSKYRACMDRSGGWEDALADGCKHRYSNARAKFRECMDY